jgi:hypothetical protein
MAQTITQRRIKGDVAPNIAEWCTKNGFVAEEATSPATVFRRGSAWVGPPLMLTVHFDGGETALDVWLHFPMFARIMALGMQPERMALESGGFKQWLHRKKAREAINPLFQLLGARPVE